MINERDRKMDKDDIYGLVKDGFDKIESKLDTISKEAVEMRVNIALLQQQSITNTDNIKELTINQVNGKSKLNKISGGLTLLVIAIPILTKLIWN